LEVAPYLRGSPRGQQVVLEGNRLVLSCLAGGSWPWSTAGASTAVTSQTGPPTTGQTGLSMAQMQRSDAGVYQCWVRNRMGAVLHRKTQVHVACEYRAFASFDQYRKTVTQGRATDGQKIIPNNRLAITLDNQLVVMATSASDAGRYQADAVNELSGESVTSPAVYVSISGRRGWHIDDDNSE
uniref:Sidekick cell adhesion molecule 1a n=1 Tax=Neogobius melanostomus TaxID=47308 RepID=A0A8C6TLL2_9GOBI